MPSLPAPLPALCVALSAPTPADLFALAEATLADTSFLEFRLDYLADPAAALPSLRLFLAEHPTVLAIATCRRLPDGGHFAGTPADELFILSEAARAGCRIVDLPLDAAEVLPPAVLDQLRLAGAAVLLSHHDFHTTPDLAPLLDRALALQPDLVKLVPTATALSDNLAVLDLLRAHTTSGSPVRLVALAMGEQGLPSRVLGPAYGSAFTFAAPSGGAPTAPGQVSARPLLDLYQIPALSRETRLFGVAGSPVSHSLSPLMLNTAFHQAGISAVYLPLLTADLPDLLSLVRGLSFSGLSVTMPHKQHIMSYLEELSPLARRVGAVNTVVRRPDGTLFGDNTDAAGIVTPLRKRLGSLQNTRILVLGAGGAARAAVFGLTEAGASVVIANRTAATAIRLASEASAEALSLEQVATKDFDIIINSTPLGMAGHPQASPLAAHDLRATLAFDLVYNPLETPFLQAARVAGLQTIGGYEMFVYQGARQFELWTGQPAPEHHMLTTVLHALHARQIIQAG